MLCYRRRTRHLTRNLHTVGNATNTVGHRTTRCYRAHCGGRASRIRCTGPMTGARRKSGCVARVKTHLRPAKVNQGISQDNLLVWIEHCCPVENQTSGVRN